MLVIYGKRTAGRIHTGDNLVSTVFFHVFFIPILPMMSVLVAKKRFILDIGEVIPLNRKSILAGYLRIVLFGVLCLGLEMTFDGLFLNSVYEKDKPLLIFIGVLIYSGASIMWILTMFFLGAKRDDFGYITSLFKLKLIAGLVCLVMILGLMFTIDSLLPEKRTIETIVEDQTISDQEAINEMAEMVFPDHAQVDTSKSKGGIHLRVSYVLKEATTRSELEKGKTYKSYILMLVAFSVKNIIQHGQHRGLSNLHLAIYEIIPAEEFTKGHTSTEVYQLHVPQDKFDDIINIEVNREFIKSSAKILQNLDIVVLDNFE